MLDRLDAVEYLIQAHIKGSSSVDCVVPWTTAMVREG